MKNFMKIDQRDLRNWLMLFVLSGLSILAVVSMVNESLFNKMSADNRATGYSANFGADLIAVDAVIAREFEIPAEGIIVNQVHPNGIASRAGLFREDVIIALNGSVVNSVSIFKTLFFSTDTATLTVLRGQQELTLNLSPGSGPISVTKHVSDGSFKTYLTASVIFIAVFSLLFFNLFDRVVVITLGAALMIVAGGYVGFYSHEAAFSSINLNVLALLLGLNLVTLVLERAGFFEYISNSILVYSNHDTQRIFVVFCIATYLFSAFVNNLTTIMVLLPVSLALIKNMKIDIKKFLFCEIVASNLGGASTMIGDFPNMLISSQPGVLFHDFIFNMTPVTALLLAIMIYYFSPEMKTNSAGNAHLEKMIEKAKHKIDTSIKDYAAVTRGITVLLVLIVGFMLSGILHIHPAVMAITGGFALLLFESNPSKIIQDVCFKDIIFFCSLFVLVGGFQATGILHKISYGLTAIAGDYAFLKLVYILVLAALCTSFFNAGPSTALFIPIVASMSFAEGSNLVWWALSLGVCIGSSATLSGATAGPVSISIFEKFMEKDDSLSAEDKTINFMEFTKISLPLMGIFTIVSIIYIGVLSLFN